MKCEAHMSGFDLLFSEWNHHSVYGSCAIDIINRNDKVIGESDVA
jgi:hypothetical protein